MNAILDFIRAAAPWVAMGLLLIILFARNEAKKKNEEAQASNYGMEGMCLGMCLGTAIGTALGNDAGIGISMGMLPGLAFGTGIPRKPNKHETHEN